ncbi:restriction endonuclease subunit S [Brevibacillus brevis]|uniref:Restriction endonuclease subunit S n=1 Tax=Brevibacillus brevis TaxID=1393 RepID=A0ABY9TAQ6_BREBE|nr:restriction endonuclease subunit S [Brevibacillus brevis]WNC15478.1 restriction endonuclease subunit S [Brevibacillus brevis]
MSFETGWRKCTWGDISTLEYGKALRDYKDKTSGYPVYGTNGLIGYTEKYLSDKPGVIIGRKGAYRGVHYSNRPFFVIDTAYYLSPKIPQLNLRWAYYSLRNIDINSMDSGSAIPSTSRSDFYSIEVDLPDIYEQQEIANLLSVLDDKIELNNAINKNLEEMAQALFNSWFVDFEFPNENGEPYKSSGGEFEESELGLIPKGWKQGTISELGEVAGGATPSKKNEDFYTVRGIPWITPKDLSKTNNKYISRGEIDITQKGFSNSSVKLLPKGTVLFSSRAPIGYIAIAKNEVTTNQGFKSVIPFKHVGSEFVYYLLKSNVETIECRASGSTFKEISGTEMKRVPVLIPTENVLAKFNEIVEPIGRLTQKCEEENEDLTQIRDTLLPKLMSGEIRVPVEQDHNHPDLPKVAESSAIYQP